ncbi:MAG TPA: hypothetical protein VEA16_04840 [Vicinamibacterales bacterium]|nr:hypothetical protein [Vicinamibacterales bacterium]
MGNLSRETLLAAATAAQLPTERVEVPELGGSVIVRGMSGRERDSWEKSLIIGRGKNIRANTDNVRAKLVTRCLVDEQGTRLLRDEDAEVVGNLRADVISRLYDVAQRLNGVSDADIEELKNASGSEAGSDSPSS